jgi:uncharacterized protein YkwD
LEGVKVAMFNRFLLILLLSALLIVSCTKQDLPAANETGAGNTGGSSATIVFNVNKTKLVDLVNAVRKTGCKCGSTTMPPVGAVSWNDKLAKAGYEHSVEMDANDYFSHTGLNGSGPGQRITAAGYAWRTYGENIANGYTTEQAVMNGWLSSEGHCKNIMNGSFKEMGAGRKGNYWTQVFGAR